MEEWLTLKFGDIADINRESICNGYPYGRINYLDTSSVTDNIFEKPITISIDEAPSRAKRIVKSDSIVYSTVRPNLKHFGYISKAPNNLIASTGFAVISAKTNASTRFLYYWLRQDIIINFLSALAEAQTTTFPAINPSEIANLDIDLPPLPLQQRIAEILGALDDKIELNRQMNHTLEQMAQALYKHYFVDDINPENLPEGWKNGTIYELATVIYGAPFASTEFNEIGLGLPLIRIRDLKTFKPQFYTTERHPNASTINKGDVLVGMDAEFRPCIWVGDYGYLNQRVCQFKPIRKEVHPYFIYSIIKPHLDFFEKSKVGTTVIHLGKADIDEFNVIVPSIQVQQNFNAAVDPLYSLLILSSSESQHLMNLRDVLLPKLISGEIIPADLQAIEQAL